MAIRLVDLQPHGILSAGAFVGGNDANVDRLFLMRLQIDPIPPEINTIRRFFATEDSNTSNIRWLTLPSSGLSITAVAVNLSAGSRYLASWSLGSGAFSETIPWTTLVLRIGGTPGSGRTDLFRDGVKLPRFSEENASGSFASITTSDQRCIGSTGTTSGLNDIRTLPSRIEFFHAWRVGEDAFTGTFLVDDSICAALSRGVSPYAMGMPQADIGYEFRADGSVARTGKATINLIASDGFEPGLGTYRVTPQPLIAQPVEPAEAPLEASLDSLGATATAEVVVVVQPLSSALDAEGDESADDINGAIAPLGAALAEDGATAQETFEAQVLALGAVLETLGADAVAAFSGEVIDTTPTAILNTLGAQAIVDIAAAIQPLGATLNSVGADAADSLIASLPFIPGTSGLNLNALRKRMMAYRDRIAPSQTFRVRRNGTVFRNYDGSFPRVLRLSDSQRLLVPGVSETSTVFRVRLIVESAPETAGTYELSFDGGVSWQGVRLLGSAYRDVGNNAWVFNLERGV